MLHVPEQRSDPEIEVDSASWAAWLTDPATRSFSFQSPRGRYTARKEYRSRGGQYWVAYRKLSGKLHKTYLGKVENITLERLEDVAVALTGHGAEATARPPPVDPTAVDGQAKERSHQGPHGDPLLLTKLSIPFVRLSLIARPGLSKRLEEGLERKFTLLSAPAGFGKTTLLSAWVGELSDDGRPIAWLSLDPGDNDPTRFWRYFVTAIERLQPGFGDTALALLDSPEAPPIEVILTTLLNTLADLPADTVLVLDDYHLIKTRVIHEALTFFIDHLSPRMHLIVSTRADPPLPLPSLRARGESNELRFSQEEAATFLNEVMGLELTAEEIAELEGRTEGWIAGLQMAALAMRGNADVAGFIAAFTGSNRHVVDYCSDPASLSA